MKALDAVFVVSEAVRTAGEVPSGTIFATLGIALAEYEVIIGLLIRAGLVREKADVLTWTGPAVSK